MTRTACSPDVVDALARGEAYRLLALMFRRDFCGRFEHARRDVADVWRDVAGQLTDRRDLVREIDGWLGELRAARADDVRRAFDRLFEPHAGMATPPYETEYTKLTPQHMFSQMSELADISGFYLAFGLQIDPANSDRPDHIANELEYMHVLCVKQAYALDQGDEEHVIRVRDAQEKFLRDHLARWPALFRERVDKSGVGGLYLSAARLLESWVKSDSTQMFHKI